MASRPTKRKRFTVQDFIHDDVEVDDDIEEDDDPDYADGPAAPHEYREAERAFNEQRALKRQPTRRNILTEMSEDELVAYFESRYSQEEADLNEHREAERKPTRRNILTEMSNMVPITEMADTLRFTKPTQPSTTRAGAIPKITTSRGAPKRTKRSKNPPKITPDFISEQGLKKLEQARVIESIEDLRRSKIKIDIDPDIIREMQRLRAQDNKSVFKEPGKQAMSFVRLQGTRRDRSIIGKTVRIVQGPMKGYVGTAKDATDTIIQVELHAQPKTVSVDRTRIEVIDGSGSNSIRAMGMPFASSRTPMHNQPENTPLYGASAQTPLYGAGAPMPAYDSFDMSHASQLGFMTPINDTNHDEPKAEDESKPEDKPSRRGAWDPLLTTGSP